jgi:hypothetical protein
MCIPISFLIQALEDIKVELRITNRCRDSEVLRLNLIVVFLHFVVYKGTGLFKNSI